MTEQELLDQIRAGVTQEMESALTADINPVLMHAVTQSYLLLKILDKVQSMQAVVFSMFADRHHESNLRGLQSLSRPGVTFTDEQKDAIQERLSETKEQKG